MSKNRRDISSHNTQWKWEKTVISQGNPFNTPGNVEAPLDFVQLRSQTEMRMDAVDLM